MKKAITISKSHYQCECGESMPIDAEHDNCLGKRVKKLETEGAIDKAIIISLVFLLFVLLVVIIKF